MNSATRLVSVIGGCLMAISASAAWGQDWPQWRGPNRDSKAIGFKAPATWPKELTQKWKVTVGPGDSTPALVGDRLYVFSREDANEVARCLDAATGKEIWQDKYEAQGATGPASGHSGPRSSPTVVEGKVLTLGVRGTLSCLDAATGKVLWRKDDFAGSWPQYYTASSPIAVNGMCIAQLGGQQNGAVVAYELGSGNEKWRWTGDGAAYASPVVVSVDDAQVVIAETDKSIVALRLTDGELVWRTDYEVQGRGYNAATPIVDGATLVYSGSGRGAKAVKLEKKGDALAASDLWTNSENSVQFNSPILKDGLLFGITSQDSLFCIRADSGQTAWTAELGGRGRVRGYGSIIDAGPVLIALNPTAQLVVFEPTDKEFKELARYKVAESETFAHPVLAGNRIYVKDQDSVTLWTIE
ncbi:MAG: PQQ-like beta-propeller repeat protein [Planctomycetes bacterium]|nr:PQQ-like beta-propeller repeat protein [Planctomycetota bacterium]